MIARALFVFIACCLATACLAGTQIPLLQYWDPTNNLGTFNDWIVNDLDPNLPPPGEAVDVRYFGATCNGVTDDTAAFQSGLQAVGNVAVPNGMSCAYGNLTLSSNQNIFAYGGTMVPVPGSSYLIRETGTRSGVYGGYINDTAGNLAAQTTLASPVTTFVNSAQIVSTGYGGTPGACTVTGITGTGTPFQATVTIDSTGAIDLGTTVPTVTVAGSYSALPGWSNVAANVTGTIAATVLTVSAVNSGTPLAGGLISGTGIPAGTYIVNQISGTQGSTGTYLLNAAATVSSGETIVEAPAYPPDVTDEPVTSDCSLNGATFLLEMGSSATLTVSSLAATATNPAVQVEQRCGVEADTGYWYWGWITTINASTNQITLSNQMYAPASVGNPVWCTFGAIWQNGCSYCEVSDTRISAWGQIMQDSVGSQTLEARINNVITDQGRIFSVLSGRGLFNGEGIFLYLTGYWHENATWTGDGITTSFTLPYRVFKATSTWGSLTVNSVTQTFGTDYHISTDGLHVVFVSPPAAAAAILASYGPRSGEGLVLDNNSGGNNFTHVWSQGNDVSLHLVNTVGSQINGFESDIATYASILQDGAGAVGTTITAAQVGYGPYGLRVINTAKGLSVYYTGGVPPAGVLANGIPGVVSLIDLGSTANMSFCSGGSHCTLTYAGLPLLFAGINSGQPNQLAQVCIGCPAFSSIVAGSMFDIHGTAGDMSVSAGGTGVLLSGTFTSFGNATNSGQISMYESGVNGGIYFNTLGTGGGVSFQASNAIDMEAGGNIVAAVGPGTAQNSGTATFTNSSASISWIANGLVVGQAVTFAGSPPTPFIAGEPYYVTAAGTNAFDVSTLPYSGSRGYVTAGAGGTATVNSWPGVVVFAPLAANNLSLTAAAGTVPSGQVGFGGTTAAAANCIALATGCLTINVGGTTRYVPYY